MPQPIRTTCHVEISGLAHRPQHAAVLGRIVGISGRIESALGWLLAFLSRGSAGITMSMFHAVASTEAQRAMLLAAANKALAGAELEAFCDLMDDFRPRYGERSKLVHNLWGHSNDHPDKALWWKAADLGTFLAQVAAAKTKDEFDAVNAQSDISRKAMAYTVQDLENVAIRLDEYLRRLNVYISELWVAHRSEALETSTSSDAPPIGEQPQLKLPENS